MTTLKSTWFSVPADGLIRCLTTGPNDLLVAVRTDGVILTKQPTSALWSRCAVSSYDANSFAKSIARRADGVYIGILTDGTINTRSLLNGGYWFGGWQAKHLAMVTGNDGTLIGVTDAGLQTSTKHDGPWYTVPNSGGMISAAQLTDGTVLGVGKDNFIYAWDTLSGGWTKFSDKYPVISLAEHRGQLVVVTTANKLFAVDIVPTPLPAGIIPIPLYYSQKLKLVSESFTEVDNNILVKGNYEVQFSDTEVRLDIAYLALIDVEIPASVSADWKVTPKRVTRNVGTLTPGGQSTRQFAFEQLIGKDELLHSLHSTRAFNDASIALSMRLQLISTIQNGDLTTANVVTLGAVVAPAPLPPPAAVPSTPALPVIDTTDDLRGTITARGDNGPAEGKEKAFDNQSGSKWLDFLPVEGSWIQYTYAAGSAGRLSAYTITSGNDAPERDPYTWQLLGSNDGGKTWTAVDLRSGIIFKDRFQKQTFAITGSPTYKAYRLNITVIASPTLSTSVRDCLQLSEIELLGQLVAV